MITKLKKIVELTTTYCAGLLFVGDPHMTEKKPSRRLDEDYLGTLDDKLTQVAKIANENNYQVVILGDLFDRAVEKDDNAMMRVLYKFLRSLNHTAKCLAGNHDLTETVLTPDTSLALVEMTGLLDVVSQAGFFARCMIDGKTVLLGGTPSGQEIPDEAPLTAKCKEASDHNIWITHEDLQFPGAYPNALPFKEIKDVELVVNGHMHRLQPEHVEGETTWFNPGNIIRKTVADIDHIPAVWSWTPAAGLNRYPLKYKKDMFDLTNYRVEKASKEDVLESLNKMESSQFVALLQQSIEHGKQTEDGGLITEIMEGVHESMTLSTPAKAVVDKLLKDVIEA